MSTVTSSSWAERICPLKALTEHVALLIIEFRLLRVVVPESGSMGAGIWKQGLALYLRNCLRLCAEILACLVSGHWRCEAALRVFV